jgi:hypothetical protein
MNFRDFFMGLDKEARKVFADRAGTSVDYLLVGFFSTKDGKPRKRPGDDLLKQMVAASEGAVSIAEALDYFGVASLDDLKADPVPRMLGACRHQ